MNPAELNITFIDSIHQCPREDWQALLIQLSISYPFIQFDYLAALEDSHSCTETTGWKPKHCLIFQAKQLVGFMPCYEKHHSYGEYVFDHQWAQAYQQQGLHYYPKLLTAIPFTPCAGPRLIIDKAIDQQYAKDTIIQSIQTLCDSQHYSGWHYLFPQQALKELPSRRGVQFHWYNKNYLSFDHFLSFFSSRKRKVILKERRKVEEQGFNLRRIEGTAATAEDWQRFYHFYQLTYAKRSGHGGYLTERFFEQLAKTFSHQCLLVFANLNNKTVAGALYFKDDESLYGRYWGCYEEFDFLHFECCYYQGIDYCIEHKLKHIDAGAQGEHKIARGFEPIYTYSNHYLQHSGFYEAVKHFCDEEKPHIQSYKKSCFESLPYKK